MFMNEERMNALYKKVGRNSGNKCDLKGEQSDTEERMKYKN